MIEYLTKESNGRRYKHPVKLEYRDGRIWFVESPFALKDELKSLKGSRWHGRDEPPLKVWSALDCERNNFQLEYLSGGNPFRWWERPLEQQSYLRPLHQHQKLMSDHMLTYHYGILAAEMGCISGEAVVHCNRAGKGFEITLADLHHMWKYVWDSNLPVFVKSMKDGLLGLNLLNEVLDKGAKDTRVLKLESGKSLECTGDHEIYVSRQECVRADTLTVGDTVITSEPSVYLPTYDRVVSIIYNRAAYVYDLVMADPYRNFVANGFIVHNCGKTLSAIEVMERSGVKDWWWVGPKSALAAVEQEFVKWKSQVIPRLMTYEGLRKIMRTWKAGDPAPDGAVFDESSRLKGASSQRTQAAQALADAIRYEHGRDGYVILMSGTPSPKSPVDWWSQAEIAWPGFIREGSAKSFEFRLGLYEKKQKIDGFYWNRVTWLDDEKKCAHCGQHECSEFTPSKNEVAYLSERMDGLVVVLHKKDCLDLPDKQYRVVNCQPSKTITRVAKTLAEIAPTTIQALTWLRELSDGFQYHEVQKGVKRCEACAGSGVDRDETCFCDGGNVPKMVREAKMIPCPKDQAVKDLLEENEEQGRLVIFAGFTGSIDRVRQICLDQNWDVVQVDGRGWKVYGTKTDIKPLAYWQSDALRVVFLAHPQSGGMGLTLTEARMAVFYSNDFNPESRSQAEDRIHRMGMDNNLGATIVDIFHLPTDKHVRDVLKNNRKLELMTLGEVQAAL